MDIGVDPRLAGRRRIGDRVGADPVALVQDRESSIAVCGRQSDCCCGMSDPRKSATDGPGKSAHQERPSQNRRPLLTRAKLKHGMASTFDETGSYSCRELVPL